MVWKTISDLVWKNRGGLNYKKFLNALVITASNNDDDDNSEIAKIESSFNENINYLIGKINSAVTNDNQETASQHWILLLYYLTNLKWSLNQKFNERQQQNTLLLSEHINNAFAFIKVVLPELHHALLAMPKDFFKQSDTSLKKELVRHKILVDCQVYRFAARKPQNASDNYFEELDKVIMLLSSDARTDEVFNSVVKLDENKFPLLVYPVIEQLKEYVTPAEFAQKAGLDQRKRAYNKANMQRVMGKGIIPFCKDVSEELERKTWRRRLFSLFNSTKHNIVSPVAVLKRIGKVNNIDQIETHGANEITNALAALRTIKAEGGRFNPYAKIAADWIEPFLDYIYENRQKIFDVDPTILVDVLNQCLEYPDIACKLILFLAPKFSQLTHEAKIKLLYALLRYERITGEPSMTMTRLIEQLMNQLNNCLNREELIATKVEVVVGSEYSFLDLLEIRKQFLLKKNSGLIGLIKLLWGDDDASTHIRELTKLIVQHIENNQRRVANVRPGAPALVVSDPVVEHNQVVVSIQQNIVARCSGRQIDGFNPLRNLDVEQLDSIERQVGSQIPVSEQDELRFLLQFARRELANKDEMSFINANPNTKLFYESFARAFDTQLVGNRGVDSQVVEARAVKAQMSAAFVGATTAVYRAASFVPVVGAAASVMYGIGQFDTLSKAEEVNRRFLTMAAGSQLAEVISRLLTLRLAEQINALEVKSVRALVDWCLAKAITVLSSMNDIHNANTTAETVDQVAAAVVDGVCKPDAENSANPFVQMFKEFERSLLQPKLEYVDKMKSATSPNKLVTAPPQSRSSSTSMTLTSSQSRAITASESSNSAGAVSSRTLVSYQPTAIQNKAPLVRIREAEINTMRMLIANYQTQEGLNQTQQQLTQTQAELTALKAQVAQLTSLKAERAEATSRTNSLPEASVATSAVTAVPGSQSLVLQNSSRRALPPTPVSILVSPNKHKSLIVSHYVDTHPPVINSSPNNNQASPDETLSIPRGLMELTDEVKNKLSEEQASLIAEAPKKDTIKADQTLPKYARVLQEMLEAQTIFYGSEKDLRAAIKALPNDMGNKENSEYFKRVVAHYYALYKIPLYSPQPEFVNKVNEYLKNREQSLLPIIEELFSKTLHCVLEDFFKNYFKIVLKIALIAEHHPFVTKYLFSLNSLKKSPDHTMGTLIFNTSTQLIKPIQLVGRIRLLFDELVKSCKNTDYNDIGLEKVAADAAMYGDLVNGCLKVESNNEEATDQEATPGPIAKALSRLSQLSQFFSPARAGTDPTKRALKFDAVDSNSSRSSPSTSTSSSTSTSATTSPATLTN